MNQIATTNIELVVKELPISRNEAQRLYMNKRNADNVIKARTERNSQRANRCFNVPEDIAVNFKNNIHRLVELKNIVSEMPPEMFDYFLLKHAGWDCFEKKQGLKPDGTKLKKN